MPGKRLNPLTPRRGKNFKPSTSPVSLVGSLQLGPVKPPSLVMALYRIDYNADGRKAPGQNVWNGAGGSLLVDQPINGCGPWFSGLRPLWHRQQFADLRRAGIDVALVPRAATIRCLAANRRDDGGAEGDESARAGLPAYRRRSVGGQRAADDHLHHVPAEFRATVTDATGQRGLIV